MDSRLMKLNTTSIVKTASVFFLVSLLAACSSQSVKLTQADSSLFMSTNTGSALPVEVSGILTESPQDLLLVIPSGPLMGKSLSVGSTYFAASGRQCRKADLIDRNTEERYVACLSESGKWVLIQASI